MAGFRFRCTECATPYDENDVRLVCPACAESQEPGGVTRGVLEVELDELPSRWPQAPPPHPDFLTAFLPLPSAEHLPPLPVGGTPLVAAPQLRRALDMEHLWIKDDTRNPSGSTKDRASLLVVAKARQYGLDTVAAASTGNAATALAAVSAAAGTRAILFVPANAPEAKLVQMLSYGATVLPIDGNYDDAFELCLAACEEFGWYNRNTALNPFTIEGKKTAALEIAASMSPEVPDAVLVPVGDGVILAGVAKGFRDLERSGLIDRVPRLIAVQPEGKGWPGDNRAGPGCQQRRRFPDGRGAAERASVHECHPRLGRERCGGVGPGHPGVDSSAGPAERCLRRAIGRGEFGGAGRGARGGAGGP
jgi:threonine synthase